MCDAESFLQILKQLDFPKAHKYKYTDFEKIFSDKELKPILKSICCLKNVLTAEELAEYESIHPTELARFERIAEQDTSSENVSDEENREEVQYLKEHLALIEEQNQCLQHQNNLLKSHEYTLLEEKRHFDQVLVDSKKQFQTYSIHKIPQVETEFVSTLNAIVDIITEEKASITESEKSGSKILPSSIFKEIEAYFEDEKKIIHHIKVLLKEHFKVDVQADSTNFSLEIPGYSPSKLLKEVYFLENVLKKAKVAEFEALIAKETMKTRIELYKKGAEKQFAHIFEISPTQLSNKLGEETKHLEQLKERERLLKAYLLNATNKHIKAQCDEIGLAQCEEIIQHHNINLEKIQAPLEQMIAQRSRLELLMLYLNVSKTNLEKLRSLIDLLSQFVNEEKEMLNKMKSLDEERGKLEPEAVNPYLSDDSVLLSVYKILSGVDHQELSCILPEEVVQKMKKLHEDKMQSEKAQEDKFHILELMAKQSSALEKVIFSGKEFSKLLEQDKNFNIKLNKLHLKMSQVQKTLLDYQKQMDEKTKILERNPNLRFSRNLYLYALLDRSQYEQCIERIKVASNYESGKGDTSSTSQLSEDEFQM